jgi:hypothetical protein
VCTKVSKSKCKSKRELVPLSVSSGLTGRLVEGSPGTSALLFPCTTQNTTQMCATSFRGEKLDTDRDVHVHGLWRR